MGKRLVVVVLAFGCLLAGAPSALAHDFELRVLSSPPTMVTGGDALVQVTVPHGVPLHKARLLVNGDDVTSTLDARRVGAHAYRHGHGSPAGQEPARRRFERHGKATREAEGRQPPGDRADLLRPAAAAVRLQDADAGARVPAGRQPGGHRHAPLRDPRGTRRARSIGWSKDCTVSAVVDYRYRSTDGTFKALPPGPLPPDVAQTTLARRPDRPVRLPPRAWDDQPLHLRDLGPVAAGRPSRRARPLALERPR